MAEVQPPSYEAECYTPQQFRALWDSIICAEGVCDKAAGDLQVLDAPTGLQVNVSAGCAWIQGDTVQNQGIYYVYNDAAKTMTHDAADPVDGRIDLIVARVYDSEYSGTDNRWAIEIVKGTPSPSPVAKPLPDNSISLAQVSIPAGATTITQANITDTRTQFTMCSGTQPAQGLVGQAIFTSNGSFSKASYPGLRAVEVEVVGGGGGGGAAAGGGSGLASAGGGGGGGGYSKRFILASALPANVTVTVGAGGAGAAAGSNSPAPSGGVSSFGSFASATGGDGGAAGAVTGSPGISASSGGAGGVGTSPAGALNLQGSRGELGRVLNAEVVNWGTGGDAFYGYGASSPQGSGGVTGRAGQAYGGGGGGGVVRLSGTSLGGGSGADGIVIVRLYN